MASVKVLVTGAGALLGQGILKCLLMSSTVYEIVAVDPDPRAVGLYWAHKAYLIPFASAPNYLERVEEILAQERPHLVLIGTDVELVIFAQQRARLESAYDTRVIVSAPEVIRIANDKWLTYQFLKTHGFPHPQSALPANLQDFLRECDFPLVVKPRTGARSIGVHRVQNEAELFAALARVENPIIQEEVATSHDEFTTGILMADRRARAIITMRRDLRDGNTYRAYVESDAPYTPRLVELAEQLGGFGPLNFQFRLAAGEPKIFEINARFSGTTPLRAHAGLNEVDAMIQHVMFDAPIIQPSLQSCVLLRYWSEIIVEPAQLDVLAREHVLAQPRALRGL